jgi:hypothetical protein
MTHIRIGIIAALTMVAPVGRLAAQQAHVAVGQRVRVASAGEGPFFEGRVVRLAADTVVLSDGRIEDSIVLGGRRRLWIAAGTRSYGHPGFIVGAALGVVVGALVYPEPPSPPPCTDYCVFDTRDIVPFVGRIKSAGLGLLVGAVVGAWIGSEIRTTLWQPVGPDAGVRVGIAPLPNGRLGLGASVSF